MKRLGAVLSVLGLVALTRCATSEDEPERNKPGGYADSGSEKGGTGGTGGSKNDGSADAPPSGGTAGDASGDEPAADAALDVAGDAAADSPIEAGADATSDVVDSGSNERLLLVGRNASEIVLAESNGGAWQKKSIAFAGASTPAIVATATGAVAVVRHGGDNVMHFATWSPSAGWSGLGAIATDGWTIGTPALAAASDVHLIFHGSDYKHYANRHQASGWLGFGPVSASGVQSFGPSAPAATAVGSDVIVAFEGNDHDLYTQTWSSGWQAAFAHTLLVKIATGLSPAVAASGADALVVYVETGSKKLIWTSGKGSTWSSPSPITGATSGDPVSLATLSSASVACAFRGTDQKIYASTFGGTSFTAPVGVASGYPATAAPSIAAGVSGHAAEVAFVSGGAILVSSLSGGSWTNPTPVATNNQAAVAIARFEP